MTEEKTEKIVEDAAVAASKNVADQLPGVAPDDAADVTRDTLERLKRSTRTNPP